MYVNRKSAIVRTYYIMCIQQINDFSLSKYLAT